MAKIFTSGHSKGGFDRTPRTPPGYGYGVNSAEGPTFGVSFVSITAVATHKLITYTVKLTANLRV